MQINAETTAGGLALWSTSLVEGDVRVNTTSWNEAYQPYVSRIIEATKPNQATEGGPVLCMSELPLRSRYEPYILLYSASSRQVDRPYIW